MKKKINYLVLMLLLFTSCKVEKRLYNKGFHFNKISAIQSDQNRMDKAQGKDANAVPISSREIDESKKAMVAIVPKSDLIEPLKRVSNQMYLTVDDTVQNEPIAPTILAPQDSCDRIILRTGEEVYGKVMEVGSLSIKYKTCDNLDGPTYELSKSKILVITYKNGKREKMEEEVVEKPVAQKKASSYNRPMKNTHGENMNLAGFIIGLSSLPLFFLAVIPMVGLILSWTGVIVGRRESYLAKNETLGILGIVFSAIALFGFFVAMALLNF